jgi:hypothetical protein
MGAEDDRDGLILQLLRTLPYDKAVELLQTLRTDDTPFDGSESANKTSMLSGRDLLGSFLGTSQNSLEFELVVRHPVAYPPLFPLQIAALPLESLLRPTRISVSRESLDR